MANGNDGTGPFTPGTIPLTFPLPGGEPPELPGDRAGLPLPVPPAFPVPPPIRPPGVVVPFPVPQQPIPPAVSAPGILGRILLGGTVGFGVAGVIVGVIEASRRDIERERKRREEIEKQAEIESISRRQARVARDQQVRTQEKAAISRRAIELEPAPPPEIVTAPTRAPLPEFDPIPIEIPTPTVPTPSPSPVPVQIPSPSPLPAPSTSPVPTTRPATTPSPASLPGLFPGRVPAFFPLPRFRPGTATQPRIGDLVPQRLTPNVTTPLTTLQTGTVVLPGQQPAPQPNPDRRRCEEVKRRRRRKGKCREGFYREFPNKTRFTEWREVDCITRRETTTSKLRNRGFDVDNVLDFPSLGI